MKKSQPGLPSGVIRPKDITTIFITKIQTRRKIINVEVDRTWNEFIVA